MIFIFSIHVLLNLPVFTQLNNLLDDELRLKTMESDLEKLRAEYQEMEQIAEAYAANEVKMKKLTLENKQVEYANALKKHQLLKEKYKRTTSMEQSELAVKMAQENLDDTVLYAPVEGTILKLHKKVGESLSDEQEKDYTNADQSLTEAKHSLKNMKVNLNDVMGRDHDRDISLKPIQISLFEEMQTSDQILPKFLKENTKLLQMQRDIEKKQKDLENDLTDFMNDYEPYQEDLVRLEIKEMELQLQDEEYRLKQSINNLLTSLNTRQKKYPLSQIETDNAKKQYDWDQKRYEIGQMPKLKLMQSELTYLNSKQSLLTTEYELFLTRRAIDLVDKGIVVNP